MSANPPPAVSAKPVWQTHLNVAEADATPYHNFLNVRLADLFGSPPKLMLDIGCATGLFGEMVKQQHPSARVVGIELNRAAAAAARERLDYVFEQKLEEINLADAAIAPQSIDTVILADVLEHMYDPWRTLLALKPHLTPDAQLIASIPNTRHLGLMADLMDRGQWPYAERGLLDITHIRFFTLAQIHQMFSETGFKVERVVQNLDPNLVPLYNQNKDKTHISLRFGRIVFENMTLAELAELCTWQYFLRATPA